MLQRTLQAALLQRRARQSMRATPPGVVQVFGDIVQLGIQPTGTDQRIIRIARQMLRQSAGFAHLQRNGFHFIHHCTTNLFA
jgi:hypothetical protein